MARLVGAGALLAAVVASAAGSAPGPLDARWTKPVVLAPRVQSAELASNLAGRAVAAWVARRGERRVAVVAARARRRWGPAQTLARPPARFLSDVTIAGTAIDRRGAAVVIWSRPAGRGYRLEASVRPATARRWRRPTVLGPMGGAARLVADELGGVVVAWAAPRAQGAEIEVVSGSLRTGRWEKPVVLGRGRPLAEVSLAGNAAGGAAVAWIDERAGQIFAAVRSSPSSAWGPAEPLASVAPGRDALLRVLLDARGDVFVFWQEIRSEADLETGSIWSAFRPARGGWGAPEAVATGSGVAPELFQAAVNGRGDALVGWRVESQGAFAAIRRAGEDTWQPSPALAVGFVFIAGVGLDEAGNALVVVAGGRPVGPAGPLPPSTLVATWSAASASWRPTRRLFRGGLEPHSALDVTPSGEVVVAGADLGPPTFAVRARRGDLRTGVWGPTRTLWRTRLHIGFSWAGQDVKFVGGGRAVAIWRAGRGLLELRLRSAFSPR